MFSGGEKESLKNSDPGESDVEKSSSAWKLKETPGYQEKSAASHIHSSAPVPEEDYLAIQERTSEKRFKLEEAKVKAEMEETIVMMEETIVMMDESSPDQHIVFLPGVMGEDKQFVVTGDVHLRLGGADDFILDEKFTAGSSVELINRLPDGGYNWEMVISPYVDPEVIAEINEFRKKGDFKEANRLKKEFREHGLFPTEKQSRNARQSGFIRIKDGKLVNPTEKEEG